MSVLAGMVKLGGSGAYLGDERKSARAQIMSLIYKLKTVNEEVMLRQSKDIIDDEIFSQKEPVATHVVVGIDWGTQCTITCEYESTGKGEVSKVFGEMRGQLQMLKNVFNTKGSAEVDSENKTKGEEERFTFKCRADVSPPKNELPVTFEGVVELARTLPTLVENTNNGKGVPLTYHLMSLETVRKKCRVGTAMEIIYKDIDESSVRKSAEVFERVKERTNKVYDIHQDMTQNRNFISDKALRRIDEVWRDVNVEESRLKSEFKKVVGMVRSGKCQLDSLEKFLVENIPKDISGSNYEEEFEQHLRKVRLIGSMVSKGIKCIGKKDEIVKDLKKTTFIFFITNGSKGEDFEKNRNYFMRLKSSTSSDETLEFVVVDQEIVSSHVWPRNINETTIEKYVNGKRTSGDLFEEEGKYLDEWMIHLASPATDTVSTRQRTYLKLRCPNTLAENGACSDHSSKWRCFRCKQLVEYGTTTRQFYCKCGKSSPKKAKFRCSDPHHGMNFIAYPEELLLNGLSNLEAMEEINILILGETGVGKSTWINGIQNYLSFPKLEDAKNSRKCPVLIPSSFIFTESDGTTKKIRVGKDDANEAHDTGKSATKGPQSYVFTVGDRLLRLIDTPGIGDTRGVKQDEINMNNILSYLTYYSEIHAICILLKPNSARLTAMFRFCIQELLVQLHNSAKDNIVFCFTNARQTFYRPGDTLPALNKELRVRNVGIKVTKKNYFCFDNEPFRFLACLKNGVEFDEKDIASYSSSWDRSVEETVRLLEYIKCSLRPHNVTKTLGMNEARRIIIVMSKPLGEVANIINYNVQEARHKAKMIEHADNEILSLKKDLNFKGFVLVRTELDHPKTVCADPGCIERIPIGQAGIHTTVYKQTCHDRCYLDGIPNETMGNPDLFGCAAMSQGSCSKCGHSYMQHMHIRYEGVVEEKEFLSREIQDRITAIADERQQKKALIDEINKKIEDLNKEQDFIVETGAKFGSFLKEHALIPYNDAVGDYLDMCISQEELTPAHQRKEGLLENLKEMKREYKTYRSILDQAIEAGESKGIQTPEQVKELQTKLFQLPYSGANLKKWFEKVSIEHTSRNIPLREVIVQPPHDIANLEESGRNALSLRERLSNWWHRR